MYNYSIYRIDFYSAKALSDFLETKRTIFPRFYFVSQVMLLDILSNGNRPWVVLKNVHLAIKWLSDLEKKLYTLQAQGADYRLFLTMERNPNLPVALIKHDGTAFRP